MKSSHDNFKNNRFCLYYYIFFINFVFHIKKYLILFNKYKKILLKQKIEDIKNQILDNISHIDKKCKKLEVAVKDEMIGKLTEVIEMIEENSKKVRDQDLDPDRIVLILKKKKKLKNPKLKMYSINNTKNKQIFIKYFKN